MDMMNECVYRWCKVIIAVIALVVAYLYVCNNRYEEVRYYIHDKWTNTYTPLTECINKDKDK